MTDEANNCSPQAFKKLPTATVYLGLDGKITNRIKTYFDKEKISYYIAVAHYSVRDDERQYLLQFENIKRLLKIDYDEDGYDYVSKIYEYGIKK